MAMSLRIVMNPFLSHVCISHKVLLTVPNRDVYNSMAAECFDNNVSINRFYKYQCYNKYQSKILTKIVRYLFQKTAGDFILHLMESKVKNCY